MNCEFKTIFFCVPGVDWNEWSEDETSLFRKFFKGNMRDWLPLTVRGTTFSGDPGTTIWNTLRQMCYGYYYLDPLFPDPWTRMKMPTSGDDQMFCVPKGYGKLFHDLLLTLTARDKTQNCSLG